MAFEPGRTVLRRYVRHGVCTFVKPMRVVSDDEWGLLLWMAAGTEVSGLRDEDDRTLHDIPLDEMRHPRMVPRRWGEQDVLILMPPGVAYSVWWFFRDGRFTGWYVNLESPATRTEEGVDTTDQVLDIVVSPERAWAWKDEDEFVARTGHPLYFDEGEARTIRAVGERVSKLIEGGEFPFDGRYTDFTAEAYFRTL